MTVEEVAKEIELAMRSLRHFPRDGPRDPGCAWPEYWNTDIENWLAAPFAENETRIRLSQADIARVDKYLDYLQRLTPDERLVVSARADGASWRAIMRARRKRTNSHGYHKHVWRRGISRILGWMEAA